MARTQGLTKRAIKARDTAVAIARLNGFAGPPARATDTGFPLERPYPCWVVAKTDEWAVVIYDDRPGTVVSAGNHEGRYQPREA